MKTKLFYLNALPSATKYGMWFDVDSSTIRQAMKYINPTAYYNSATLDELTNGAENFEVENGNTVIPQKLTDDQQQYWNHCPNIELTFHWGSKPKHDIGQPLDVDTLNLICQGGSYFVTVKNLDHLSDDISYSINQFLMSLTVRSTTTGEIFPHKFESITHPYALPM